jgi:hypothetical protein
MSASELKSFTKFRMTSVKKRNILLSVSEASPNNVQETLH